jgi:hypothetical protein
MDLVHDERCNTQRSATSAALRLAETVRIA